MSLAGSPPASSPPPLDTSFDRRVSGASISSLPVKADYEAYYKKYGEERNLSREDLTELYHILMKEKRELRRRNAQAQTNIVQYFRKHKMDLFSGKNGFNTEDLKEEYSQLLAKMMSLCNERVKESATFGMELESIDYKTLELESEVYRLSKVIGDMKADRVKGSLSDSMKSDKAISKRDKMMSEHSKAVATLSEEMRPHRMEFVRLRERLEWLEKKQLDICADGEARRKESTGHPDEHGDCEEEDLSYFLEDSLSKGDTLELALENQVYADRLDKYKNKMAVVQGHKEKKFVGITHIRMKINEVTSEIRALSEEGASHREEIQALKEESRRLTTQLDRCIQSKLELEKKLQSIALEEYLESMDDEDSGRKENEVNLKKFII